MDKLNPLSCEMQQQQNNREIFIILISILLHTLIWWPLGYYSTRTYSIMMGGTLLHLAIVLLYTKNPSIGDALKSIFFGTIPIMLLIFNPNYALFAVCCQFFAVTLGYAEIPSKKLPYVLGSNFIGWVICYKFMDFEDSGEGTDQIKYLFHNSHNVIQLISGALINYFGLMSFGRKKGLELELCKRYQEKLLALNLELETTNTKLKTANNEFQEVLQEKENFILRFSHEIRNPLNSLLGNVELCFETTQDEELKTMLKDAKVSGEILSQLLNNVLDTAKVSSGRLEVSKNFHNIRDYLERAWIICSEMIRKKGLYGCFSVNVNVPDILEFDHHRIMQILINTISNATKFTERGDVRVFVDFIEGTEIQAEHMAPTHASALRDKMPEPAEMRTETGYDEREVDEKHENSAYEHLTKTQKKFSHGRESFISQTKENIHIPTFQGRSIEKTQISQKKVAFSQNYHSRKPQGGSKGFLRLEIIDSGCGIKKEDLEALFGKFRQVGADSSKRQIGTGLGLWISKELIELMEGKIQMYSKPNRGTALVIMLKSKVPSNPTLSTSKSNSFCQQQQQDQQQQKKSLIQKKSVERVLIVEDIPYNQEVNTRFLQKCDIKEIVVASNGQEALDTFQSSQESNPYDLILMDIDMPVMDGKTATKKIRQMEVEKGWTPAPIVFLTAYSESKTQMELLDPNGVYRANRFIPKPASLQIIKRLINDLNQTRSSVLQLQSSSFVSVRSRRDIKPSLNEGVEISDEKVVLVVDDDSFNLTMLSKMIKMCGLQPLKSSNGQGALEIYEKNWKNIKLILMDCEMPIMDGWQATEKILAKFKKEVAAYGKEIIIYGVTGHVGSEYKKKCIEVGMTGVLEKPITIEKLRSIL